MPDQNCAIADGIEGTGRSRSLDGIVERELDVESATRLGPRLIEQGCRKIDAPSRAATLPGCTSYCETIVLQKPMISDWMQSSRATRSKIPRNARRFGRRSLGLRQRQNGDAALAPLGLLIRW
jgi:hypothetical protein